jgi:hypothetical protein
MFKTQEEFLDKVKSYLTFKEMLDFENDYKFHFTDVENYEFWFVSNPNFKEAVGNTDIDFIFFLPDAKISLHAEENWMRFYTNIIPEKSKVRIKWRLPNFHELTHILRIFIWKDIYFRDDVNKVVKDFDQKLNYWSGREYWTNEICGYAKTMDNECVRKMKCGKIKCGLNLNAEINVTVEEVEEQEYNWCYSMLVGEIVEND